MTTRPDDATDGDQPEIDETITEDHASIKQMFAAYFRDVHGDEIVDALANYGFDPIDLVLSDSPEPPGFVVEIDFERLRTFSTDVFGTAQYRALARYTITHPDSVFGNAEGDVDGLANEALQNLIEGELKERIEAAGTSTDEIDYDHIDIGVNSVPKVPIRSLRAEHVGMLLTISGVARKTTAVNPKLLAVPFECGSCGGTVVMQQSEDNGSSLETPGPDPRGDCLCEENSNPQRWRVAAGTDGIVMNDIQTVKLSEPPNATKGTAEPEDIPARMEDTLAGEIQSGDEVEITGVLRLDRDDISDEDSNMVSTYVEGFGTRYHSRSFNELVIDDEDIEQIESLTDKYDNIVEVIVDSIAPSLYDRGTMREIKEAIALQLVGGVPKHQTDGSTKRPDIHILIVGDPATGKSFLLDYVADISPRAVSTSGQLSSEAGLTAAAVKDNFGDEGWSLEAGAVVLADRGLAAIDEFDKMKPSDRESMHQALEQQEVRVNKAGINANLNARCSLLAAANPEYGRFDQYERISEQIDLDPAMLSRFDLIFTVTDTTEDDDKLADHIMSSNNTASEITQAAAKRGYDVRDLSTEEVRRIVDVEDIDTTAAEPEIPPNLLRKYVAYARRNYHPTVSDECRERLEEFFHNLRNSGGGSDDAGGDDQGQNDEIAEDSVGAITTRKLEALQRLAEASARLRLSNEATEEDAERTIRVVERTLEDAHRDPETGKLDADARVSETTTAQRKDINDLQVAIEDIINTAKVVNDAIDEGNDPEKAVAENDADAYLAVFKPFEVDELAEIATDGVTPEQVVEHPGVDIGLSRARDDLNKMKKEGHIFAPDSDDRFYPL